MSFFHTKTIHFIGIGGHGVSALARLALALQIKVTGSDLEESPVVDELRRHGVQIWIGHDPSHLDCNPEMVVHTSAASAENNLEVAESIKRGISTYSYFQALGLISEERETIAVAGTNGKTTTTLMLAKILEAGGLDPLVIAGGNMAGEHGGGFRFGRGPFVVEACEAYGNFLYLRPKHLIITNIEEDHLDYYRDLEKIKEAFIKLIKQTSGGYAVVNEDDCETRNTYHVARNNLTLPTGRQAIEQLNIKTFGIERPADYKATVISQNLECQEYQIQNTRYQIQTPGRFNIYNALAASAMALSLGVKPDVVREALADFKGSWRRFEVLGGYHGAAIISDYGHHPSAVRGTIEAARQKYPGRRIITVFHPHHKWRTRMLFKEFIESFKDSDVLILHEIWSAPGREPREDNISSRDLVHELKKQGKAGIYYAANFDEVRNLLDNILKPQDVVLMMGAGYIYKLAEELAKSYHSRVGMGLVPIRPLNDHTTAHKHPTV